MRFTQKQVSDILHTFGNNALKSTIHSVKIHPLYISNIFTTFAIMLMENGTYTLLLLGWLRGSKEKGSEGGLSYAGVRYRAPRLGSFNSTDPLWWKSPDKKSYHYCSNNPIMRVAPNGMADDDIYYDEKGKEIYRVKNSNPDRNFVIKTTQTAEQIYSETLKYMAKVNPITKEQRNITVAELKKGNTTGSHMDNFVEIPNKTRGRNALMAIPDNGRGGSSVENNREYSWNFGSHDEVVDFKSGPVIDWESDKYANVDFNRHHSHFSGTKGLYFLQQAPSKDDISFAQQGNYFVWGMRNGTVYVYNSAGIIATFPMSIYKK